MGAQGSSTAPVWVEGIEGIELAHLDIRGDEFDAMVLLGKRRTKQEGFWWLQVLTQTNI